MNIVSVPPPFVIAGAAASAFLLAATDVRAIPVAVDEPSTAVLPLTPSSETPIDVASWLREETQRAMLEHEIDADRRILSLSGWASKGPGWLQSGARNSVDDTLGDEDAMARAERDLQTLKWVLNEQQRQAAARRPEHEVTGDAGDRWLRWLLPRQWVEALKAHRSWVVAGGTTLLVLVWGASIFARRPGALRASPMDTAPAPPAPRRRHRHHHHHRRRHAQPG